MVPRFAMRPQCEKKVDGVQSDAQLLGVANLVKRLRDLVAEQTGYPCVIVKTESGGWQLGLHAGSADEFQGILERLGVNTDQL